MFMEKKDPVKRLEKNDGRKVTKLCCCYCESEQYKSPKM